MKKSDMLLNIKGQFGFPAVSVYTPDTTIEFHINQAFDLLASKVLCETTAAFECLPVQKLNNTEIQLVLDVKPYTVAEGKTLPYFRSSFSLAESIQYFSINSDGVLIPVLATVLQNQLNNVMGKAFSWKYVRATGLLYAENIPEGSAILAATIKTTHTWETLSPEHVQWIFRYALAKTKIVEGRIRSKFRDNSSSLVSDGTDLLQEGNAEIPTLEAELIDFIPLNVGTRR